MVFFSYVMDWENNAGIIIVGSDVPLGLNPSVPDFDLLFETIGPAFIVAVVSYMGSIALSKQFETRIQDKYRESKTNYEKYLIEQGKTPQEIENEMLSITSSSKAKHNTQYNNDNNNKNNNTQNNSNNDQNIKNHKNHTTANGNTIGNSNVKSNAGNVTTTKTATASKTSMKRVPSVETLTSDGTSLMNNSADLKPQITPSDGSDGSDDDESTTATATTTNSSKDGREKLDAIGKTLDVPNQSIPDDDFKSDSDINDETRSLKKTRKSVENFGDDDNESKTTTPNDKKNENENENEDQENAVEKPMKPVPVIVDANQEFIAYGVANLLGSFFSSQIVSGMCSFECGNIQVFCFFFFLKNCQKVSEFSVCFE